MGWWSADIMGGDTPLDFKGDFEDKFGSADPQFNEWREEDGEDPIAFRIPSADEGIAFIQANQGYDGEIAKQVTGFLMMARGAPMNDELRALVIQGVDEELAAGLESWGNGSDREEALRNFRKLVEDYPAAGAQVEMPHQTGLFEKMAQHLGGEE